MTSGANDAKVNNFRPENAMKGTWEFNEYIMKLGTKVNDTFRICQTDANKHLWEAFDDTLRPLSPSQKCAPTDAMRIGTSSRSD